MFNDEEWDDIFSNLNRFGEDDDDEGCSCNKKNTSTKKECCKKAKKEPDPDICPKCGGTGEINRCACICTRCGHVIWGC